MGNGEWGMLKEVDQGAEAPRSPLPIPHSASTKHSPSYLAVFLMFARNSLIRDMTFRTNFLIEAVSSVCWSLMNLGFYTLVYSLLNGARGGQGAIEGWGQFEFFVFIATTILVNSLVQAFFMPNVEELSELVRVGGLDFALLKPIDVQFLISLQKISW